MAPMLRVFIEEGERREAADFTKDRITIGRADTNDIQLNDRQASRVHCAVEWQAGKPTVVDLGSQNGTFLNGERVGTAPLVPGDRIQVGACAIRLEPVPTASAAAASTPAAPVAGSDSPTVINPLGPTRVDDP